MKNIIIILGIFLIATTNGFSKDIYIVQNRNEEAASNFDKAIYKELSNSKYYQSFNYIEKLDLEIMKDGDRVVLFAYQFYNGQYIGQYNYYIVINCEGDNILTYSAFNYFLFTPDFFNEQVIQTRDTIINYYFF